MLIVVVLLVLGRIVMSWRRRMISVLWMCIVAVGRVGVVRLVLLRMLLLLVLLLLLLLHENELLLCLHEAAGTRVVILDDLAIDDFNHRGERRR